MLRPGEIQKIANRLGIRDTQIEKDYVNRALYQRNKGRDFFDLWYAYTNLELDTLKIIECFKRYLKNDDLSISKREFILNMEQKVKDKDFRGDVVGLLRAGIEYDTDKAWDII